MPNPTLSDVLEEAYASADPDTPIIPTISIYYDGLLDESGHPADIFIFPGLNPTVINADGSRSLLAKLEASAARHGGGVVTFTGLPFSITLPDTTTDPTPRATLTIDSINREMIDLMIAAAQGGKSIEVTYREYLAGSETDGPENDPPLVFNLVEVQANPVSVSGKLITLTVGARRFPFQTYTPERFRTLQF